MDRRDKGPTRRGSDGHGTVDHQDTQEDPAAPPDDIGQHGKEYNLRVTVKVCDKWVEMLGLVRNGSN